MTRLDAGPCLVRGWSPSDLRALVRSANNRKIWLNLADPFPHPYTETDAHAWFARVAAAGEPTHWAIEVDGEATGGIGVEIGAGIDARTGRFGYWLESRVDARARQVRVRARGRAPAQRVQGRPGDRQRAVCAREMSRLGGGHHVRAQVRAAALAPRIPRARGAQRVRGGGAVRGVVAAGHGRLSRARAHGLARRVPERGDAAGRHGARGRAGHTRRQAVRGPVRALLRPGRDRGGRHRPRAHGAPRPSSLPSPGTRAVGGRLEARAAELIETLGLSPHPEGGYFREIWRARLGVEPVDRRGARAALTAIYFLLTADAVSRWHRVGSDEVWHHYEGAPLELWLLPPREHRLERARLGPLADGQAPVHCVPATWWQAAHTLGAYTLVGCTVGPGFEFADFELLRDRPDLADALCRALPEAATFR